MAFVKYDLCMAFFCADLEAGRSPPGEIRLLCPYEYTDSLNQRQVWEPYLTGSERQEFDSQLRVS